MPDPNNIIVPELGLAFFGITKSANSAVKCAFLETLGQDPKRPHRPDRFRYASAREVAGAGYWSFAIVRNPWTRLASCWADKVAGQNRKARLKAWGILPGMPFDAFVERVAQIPDEQAMSTAQHFRSQCWDLRHNGRLVPDYTGRFEDIGAAWTEVRGRSRVPLPDLPRMTVTNVTPRDLYTKHTHALVAERYADDIATFGYSFELD